MNRLMQQVKKANKSKFRLWLFNMGLLRIVPFNKPHGLMVTAITENKVVVSAVNKRSNQNHIKGIHACLLATLCEYTTGLNLLMRLDPKAYRIILKSIHMTYHYQAKEDVTATFEMSEAEFSEKLVQALEHREAVFVKLPVDVHDRSGNHICTGIIEWQVKAWTKVKLKPS